MTAPAAVDVPPIAMPLELGYREVGHEVVFELARRFEVAGTAMGTLLRMDVVVDEGGAGWGLRPGEAGVLTMLLATAVRVGGFGVVAVGAALAAPVDDPEVVLELCQPAAEIPVLRFQVSDPLLQRADVAQDGGLGRGWNLVPERRGNRRLSYHILSYEHDVQRVRPGYGRRGLRNQRKERRTA
jgi:hypothetical protein